MSDVCPSCKGAKVLVGYGCPGFKRIELPCLDCGGAGTVDDQRVIWMARGVELLRFRQARKVSLREAAKLLGVKVMEWNDAERGRTDPGPMLGKVQEWARRQVLGTR